jgi:hypothetical protein
MLLPAFDVGGDRLGPLAVGFLVGLALAALVDATAICRLRSINAIAAASESTGRHEGYVRPVTGVFCLISSRRVMSNSSRRVRSSKSELKTQCRVGVCF